MARRRQRLWREHLHGSPSPHRTAFLSGYIVILHGSWPRVHAKISACPSRLLLKSRGQIRYLGVKRK